MRLDQHHNPMTGSADAVAAYDAAVADLLAYRPAVLDHLGTLSTEHTDVPMAMAYMAYLQLTSTDPRDLDGARAAGGALAAAAGNERELAHSAVVRAWSDGDWVLASRLLDALLVRWPTDMLGLLVGHQMDFFLGDAMNLRDRVGRSLGALGDHPHHGFVLGMQAFGLEESGHYEMAEAAGLAALAAHPDDVWASHAVSHVYEMQGAVDTALDFLTRTEADWGSNNLFTVHMWWHKALFLLEQQRAGDVLAIYDREVHHAQSSAVPIEMVDASALLWRLYLDGTDTGGRFAALADAWTNGAVGQPWYVFNDLHAMMAFIGGDRLDDARRQLAAIEADATAPADGATNGWASARVGLPAARALIAFAEQRYDDAVAHLLPVRRRLQLFGGSHAQRDAFQRTLVESAMRSGNHELAASLLRERLAIRPSGEFALARVQRLAAAQAARGDTRDDIAYTSKTPASNVPV